MDQRPPVPAKPGVRRIGVDDVQGVLTRGRSINAQPDARPVAVIDVGSNSVRLVVYDAARRVPMPVFNEKVLCGLGRGIDSTGWLDPEGVTMALDALQRFAVLTDSMGVDDLTVIATAAVREAEDGGAFVDAVEQRCGLKIQPIPGEEEARLSALGVLSAIPEADGLVGDLGGASFEVVRVGGGTIHRQDCPSDRFGWPFETAWMEKPSPEPSFIK